MTDETPPESSALGVRIRALKERIYATFTGLAIVVAIDVTGEGGAWSAFIMILVGIVGISAAGFLAEVVAHQVGHRRLPSGAEVGEMARIAGSALGSASIPLVVIALSGFGLIALELALPIAMGVYALTLVGIFFVASRSTGLRLIQRILTSAMLLALAALVVGVLFLAHTH